MPKRVEAKFAYKTATRSINVTEVNKERRVLFHLMVILEWDHKLPCESFTSIARRMCRCDTSKPPFQACWYGSFVRRAVDLQVHLFFTASIDWSVKAQPDSLCYCFRRVSLQALCFREFSAENNKSSPHAIEIERFPSSKIFSGFRTTPSWFGEEWKNDGKFLELFSFVSSRFVFGTNSINLFKVLETLRLLLVEKRCCSPTSDGYLKQLL